MPSYTDTSTKISNRDISVPSVCDCCELTSQFHKYFHHNKLHGDCSVAVICDYRGPTSYLHATYSGGSICVMMVKVLLDVACQLIYS